VQNSPQQNSALIYIDGTLMTIEFDRKLLSNS